MNKINNPGRAKRAHIAYLSELLRKQKDNPDIIIDGMPIASEISAVESHINDLDVLIEVQENLQS